MTRAAMDRISRQERPESLWIPAFLHYVVEDIRVERIEATPLVDPPRVRCCDPAATPNEITTLPLFPTDIKSKWPLLA